MAWGCRILLDSYGGRSPRLTTFELTYPRFIHAEFMTHRMFSRNAASSRAIPIEKMIEMVMTDPAMPVWWGKNQKGMQALEQLDAPTQKKAAYSWLKARDEAVESVRYLNGLDLHKQLANRLLEPWMWITVICSATEYNNFFNLRAHPDAQPEFQKLARMMAREYLYNVPEERHLHAPLLQPDEYGMDELEMKEVSVGRCARVSYLTHDGRRDKSADIDLHNRLLVSGHWSPFEHVAELAEDPKARSGNFTGWVQYRKQFRNENRETYSYTPDIIFADNLR
jgi:thymidylate synthase ThyX